MPLVHFTGAFSVAVPIRSYARTIETSRAYAAGDFADLSDDLAEEAVASGAGEIASLEQRSARIRKTIGHLGSEAMTTHGKPRVEAVEAVAGFSITAAERDAIWAEMQATAEEV